MVVILWIVLLGGVASAATLAGGHANADLTVPGTAAQTGADVANRAFPTGKGLAGQVVVEGAPGQIVQPRVKRVMERTIRDLETLPHMRAVTSPYAPGGQISEDRSTAVIGLTYDLGIEQVKIGRAHV